MPPKTSLSERERLAIYDRLRKAHMEIGAIYADLYKHMDNFQENAVDAVNSVLYLAESVFAKPEV